MFFWLKNKAVFNLLANHTFEALLPEEQRSKIFFPTFSQNFNEIKKCSSLNAWKSKLVTQSLAKLLKGSPLRFVLFDPLFTVF